MSADTKVAIVTGASSGIGKASAVALAKAGWAVVLFARRADALKATRAQCPKPEQILLVIGDITREEDIKRLFESTLQRFGRLDVLFNNAGSFNKAAPLDEIPLVSFQSVIDTNLTGTFLCTKEAMRIFKSQKPQGGRIINNGSIAAYMPRLHTAAYAAAKGGVLGLTRATALDGRAFNITCTQVDIGNALTEMAAANQGGGGALQADGSVKPEGTFDVKHVADTIVHIAGLPLDVTVLTFTILATQMPFVGRG
ncbi:short-chain dehydrogenase/reductase SDR [Phanerochaete sordida]|uniref:Short-chain dehydrogenase/reductase SDR n=1 Tax=Phanerochaete sordida TaxID=48140 RepID=A0A9P3LDY8_9APHY|nr:short-chain dehydrogenase/reductase SDR [Phanerochaete sordida]